MGGLCLVLVLLFSTYVLLVLQSPLWGKESWLLYFNCVPDVLKLLMFLIAFLKLYQIPYNVQFKELNKSYTVLKAVIYVTYCHTNNKKDN